MDRYFWQFCCNSLHVSQKHPLVYDNQVNNLVAILTSPYSWTHMIWRMRNFTSRIFLISLMTNFQVLVSIGLYLSPKLSINYYILSLKIFCFNRTLNISTFRSVYIFKNYLQFASFFTQLISFISHYASCRIFCVFPLAEFYFYTTFELFK